MHNWDVDVGMGEVCEQHRVVSVALEQARRLLERFPHRRRAGRPHGGERGHALGSDVQGAAEEDGPLGGGVGPVDVGVPLEVLPAPLDGRGAGLDRLGERPPQGHGRIEVGSVAGDGQVRLPTLGVGQVHGEGREHRGRREIDHERVQARPPEPGQEVPGEPVVDGSEGNEPASPGAAEAGCRIAFHDLEDGVQGGLGERRA